MVRIWFNFTTITDAKGIEKILKVMFKFVFVKMTQTKTKTCDSLVLFALGLLNTLLAQCRMNFKKTCLKKAKLSELRISWPSLDCFLLSFHKSSNNHSQQQLGFYFPLLLSTFLKYIMSVFFSQYCIIREARVAR